MVTCDISDLPLPNCIRQILEGSDDQPSHCGYCRQPSASLRCSRCKCVKYCSAECQKGHFALHKSHCKSIAKKRTLVEKNWADERPPRKGQDEIDVMTDLSLTHLTTVTTIEFADLLVQVGYRESDTIVNGAMYYREALKYYLMPLKLLGNTYHEDYWWVEDRMILMLIILGADETHTRAWFTESGSKRAVNYSPVSDAALSSQFDYDGYVRDDLTFQAMLLLSQLKLSEDWSKKFSGPTPEDALENCDTIKHMMDKQFEQILLSLLHNKHNNFVAHLKNTIPLQREHAPTLFSPAVFNQEFFFETPDAPAPSELWMIYQDSFFENGLTQYLPD